MNRFFYVWCLTNVTYSNDKNLIKQDINFGKNYLIKSVYVYDKNESIKMKMVFNNVDMNKNYDTNYFTLEENCQTLVSTFLGHVTGNMKIETLEDEGTYKVAREKDMLK